MKLKVEIRADSPRADNWLEIFQRTWVYVEKRTRPIGGGKLLYFLAVNELSEDEKKRLVANFMKRYGWSESEAEADIKKGVAILGDDVQPSVEADFLKHFEKPVEWRL
jgi:hypothetical protein